MNEAEEELFFLSDVCQSENETVEKINLLTDICIITNSAYYKSEKVRQTLTRELVELFI